jgi:hypothetical protein
LRDEGHDEQRRIGGGKLKVGHSMTVGLACRGEDLGFGDLFPMIMQATITEDLQKPHAPGESSRSDFVALRTKPPERGRKLEAQGPGLPPPLPSFTRLVASLACHA